MRVEVNHMRSTYRIVPLIGEHLFDLEKKSEYSEEPFRGDSEVNVGVQLACCCIYMYIFCFFYKRMLHTLHSIFVHTYSRRERERKTVRVRVWFRLIQRGK